MTPHAPPAPPSRFRFVVLALLCLLAMITYMDRAANGSAKKAIMKELNEHQLAVGEKPYVEDDFYLVLFAFQLAYALFEIPSGWLGDVKGPRSTLLRVVIWWTVFVALTGLTGLTLPWFGFVGLGALTVVQFLFGVGEAGAFPNISKSLYNWFPASDRGFAKSTVWMSARLMGGLTPLVWVLLTSSHFGGLSWRWAMWLFVAAAAGWCVLFYLVFRNRPAEHPAANAAEVALIDAGRTEQAAVRVPWGKLLRSKNLWALCGMYVVTNFCWYFLMYNLPGRLRSQFQHLTTEAWGEALVNLLAGAPLLVGMVGCLLGGALSDRFIRRTGDRKWGRRLYGMIGYGLAGVCYLGAAWAMANQPGNLALLAGLLILMGFFNDLIMAPAWAAAQDIGRQYAGTVSGAMNMVGNLLGSVTGILFTGWVLKAHTVDAGQPTEKVQDVAFVICFVVYAVVYFAGVGMWLLIDAAKPVAPDEPLTPPESPASATAPASRAAG